MVALCYHCTPLIILDKKYIYSFHDNIIQSILHFTFQCYSHTMHLSVWFNFDPTGHSKSSANFFWLLRTIFTLQGLGACAILWTYFDINGLSFEWKKIVPHTSGFLHKWESTNNQKTFSLSIANPKQLIGSKIEVWNHNILIWSVCLHEGSGTQTHF